MFRYPRKSLPFTPLRVDPSDEDSEEENNVLDSGQQENSPCSPCGVLDYDEDKNCQNLANKVIFPAELLQYEYQGIPMLLYVSLPFIFIIRLLLLIFPLA